jgi:hypothetical protein
MQHPAFEPTRPDKTLGGSEGTLSIGALVFSHPTRAQMRVVVHG